MKLEDIAIDDILAVTEDHALNSRLRKGEKVKVLSIDNLCGSCRVQSQEEDACKDADNTPLTWALTPPFLQVLEAPASAGEEAPSV